MYMYMCTMCVWEWAYRFKIMSESVNLACDNMHVLVYMYMCMKLLNMATIGNLSYNYLSYEVSQGILRCAELQ